MPGKSRARQAVEAYANQMAQTPGSAYLKSFDRRATEYCMLSATNAELAAFFHVTPETIDAWIRDKPSFRRAIENGREAADSRVARSLYRRANGMTLIEQREVLFKGKTKTLKTLKQIPPDTQAAGLWLSNRQRGKWRSANAGDPGTGGFDLAGFVSGLAQLGQQMAKQAGDDAKPVDPQDVVLEPPKG